MKTNNLTILFTDIKGFTSRTSKSSREELETLLQLHDDLIKPVFEDFGGEVIKTIGDAFMVKFTSPTNAVLCGMKIQHVLDKFNKDKGDDEKIEVRVAINSGEVTEKGNDVFGEAVNIAARLEGIADAGDIYFTESVYLAMNKAEIPTAEVGYRHFKGIPEEVKVYKVLREAKKGAIRKEKPVKREGSFWQKHKKWIIGIFVALIIIIILIAILKNTPQKDPRYKTLRELGINAKNEEQLKAQIQDMAIVAAQAIENGDEETAGTTLDKLDNISNIFGRPETMQTGIDKLWDKYDAKFEKSAEEIQQLITDTRQSIKDGDKIDARDGIAELKDIRDSGHEELSKIIIELEAAFKNKFTKIVSVT
jgi:class 3 adenylate cyclase